MKKLLKPANLLKFFKITQFFKLLFPDLPKNYCVRLREVNFKANDVAPWRRSDMVLATAQLHSTKSELRFCAGWNPARGVLEIRGIEDLWQWSRLEISLITLSSVNHTTKTIHHHHHEHAVPKNSVHYIGFAMGLTGIQPVSRKSIRYNEVSTI